MSKKIPAPNDRGKTKGSLDALENGRWKPGQSGNPAGRKPGTRERGKILRELMDIKINVSDPSTPGGKKSVTLYEAAAMGQFQAAMKGNTNAWKEIQDTLFGKIVDKHEFTGKIDVGKLSDEQLQQLAETGSLAGDSEA